MAGRCSNPPCHDISGSSFLLLPARVSAAGRCPLWELFLCPWDSSLSMLTEPNSPAVCSALPCRHLLAAGHWPGTPLCLGGVRSSSDKCSRELGSQCLLQNREINSHLTEPQSHRTAGVGKDLWRSSCPTPLQNQGHLKQVAQDHIQAGFKYLQRRRLHNHSGQPVTGHHHPQSEAALLDVQLELPMLQFVPIAPVSHCPPSQPRAGKSESTESLPIR